MTDDVENTPEHAIIRRSDSRDLKLVHILWTIIAAAMLVGVAWGVMQTNIVHQGKQIEEKLDKDVFEMHLEAQRQQTETFVTTVKEGFDRMDKRLENIENK